MGLFMKAMVKFTKRLKEIVQIMYLYWVGSVLTIKLADCFGELVSPKVYKKRETFQEFPS